jgi:hypothetical protein
VELMGNFDQTHIAWDLWVFKSKDYSFNILGTKCWHENVKFYELQQIMQQNYMQLIFWINFEQHKISREEFYQSIMLKNYTKR